MKRCPHCGAKNKDRFNDCVRCSAPLEAVKPWSTGMDRSSVVSFMVLLSLLVVFAWAWQALNPPPTDVPIVVPRPASVESASQAPPSTGRGADLQQIRDLGRAGMIAFHEKEYEKAAMLFEQLNNLAPENPFGHMYLGLSHYFLGNQDLAIQALADAFQRAPEAPRLRDYLVVLLKRSEDYARAEEVIQTYLQFAPDDQEARLARVELIRLQGDWEEAIAEAERLVAEVPENIDVVLELGACLKDSGEFTRAGEMFRRAAELDPKSSVARYNLGATALLAGNYEKALQPLKEAVSLDPQNGLYHLSLAQAYENTDRIEESLDEYEAFLELSPDDPRAGQIARLVERARKALQERSQQKNT